MKILKYIFLLFLMSVLALSVFLATQDAQFETEKTAFVSASKSTVYSYISNTDTWKEWNTIAIEDSLLKIENNKNNTIKWLGKEGSGSWKNLPNKTKDSLVQEVFFNGNKAKLVLYLKDSLGGTKVHWKAKGEMVFLFKMLTYFNGGASKYMSNILSKSLVAINTNLNKNKNSTKNTYLVTLDGITTQLPTNYLAQTFTSEIKKVAKNAAVVFYKINTFCKENNLSISGKPFAIFHTYDTIKQLTKVSFCIPIKDSILISEGSDIRWQKLASFKAVKATLKGSYSHKNEAHNHIKTFLKSQKLLPGVQFSHLEIYPVRNNETKKPSEWITEIVYPMLPKKRVKPVLKSQNNVPEAIIKPAPVDEVPTEI